MVTVHILTVGRTFGRGACVLVGCRFFLNEDTWSHLLCSQGDIQFVDWETPLNVKGVR